METIQIGIIGCGWVGSRIANNLNKINNVNVCLLVDTNKLRAKEINQSCNLHAKISDNFKILENIQLDIICDCTGKLLSGIYTANLAREIGAHFITSNNTLDVVFGLKLANLAKEEGLIYTNIDGDQPGCLAKMLNEIISWGFTPQIAGNCKQYLDPHATPETVRPYVSKGLNSYQVCQFTDGTKQAFELASLSNAFEYPIFKRGCYGPYCKKGEILSTFDNLVNLCSIEKGYIDFTLGSCEPDQGGPIFVIASTEDECLRSEMEHLKMGPGPSFLFFRDYHLVTVEAPGSVLNAVQGISTLYPISKTTDVIAVAKRDLKSGDHLDGIGGFDCYGICEDREKSYDILPIGLAEFAIMKNPVKKDEAIFIDDVDFEDNPEIQPVLKELC